MYRGANPIFLIKSACASLFGAVHLAQLVWVTGATSATRTFYSLSARLPAVGGETRSLHAPF